MPLTATTVTEADGTIMVEIRDDAGNLRERYAERHQPQPVKHREAALDALATWALIRDFHADIVAGGLSEWQQVAADAGLPTSQGAYDTATAFLLARRRKATSRALAAINRWRLA